MNKLLFLLAFLFGFSATHGQVLGKTVTEDYTAGFEKQASVYQIPEYDGMPVPVAILSIGVNEQVLEQYPELGDYRVGLGLSNITVAFMDETFRFEFVETRDEIKDRMVAQYKASQRGITSEKLKLVGNITAAKYFGYIEVYDFSISEDETVNLKDGIKNVLVTRLGLQVRLVDAQTGVYMTGSGLGKSTTTREMTLLNDANLEEVAFNQSSIGTATKKALNTAVYKIVKRMRQKKIFDH
tara:strand:+ start:195 stop:914 length:720 start_codon:yes stop_codon:yes gene_type:complete